MLEYRINTSRLSKTKIDLNVERITFTDLSNLSYEGAALQYDGMNRDKVMAVCECRDIDRLTEGCHVKTEHVIFLDYGDAKVPDLKEFRFIGDYQVSGVNEGNRSFTIYTDKYHVFDNVSIEKIPYNTTLDVDDGENILLRFDGYHYFSSGDRHVPVYFRTTDSDGETILKSVDFGFYAPDVLIGSTANFKSAGAGDIFRRMFGFSADAPNIDEIYSTGDMGGIDVMRESFLFRDDDWYSFSFERPVITVGVPFESTFETNLMQMELLNEYFVDNEKRKAINGITDIEKDVYYPCIPSGDSFDDVYTIKFNLHFREHRGDEWLVENGSFWNCIESSEGSNAAVAESEGVKLTEDGRSDLLTFLNFTNEDVHYQKNRLKKSFLRLMYFDSTNSANQNMIGYSTVFFDTGEMFARYMKYFGKEGYTAVGASRGSYGVYNPSADKKGIRVDRESFEDSTRLSSQMTVKGKNTSRASSEGFYIYIWKTDSTPMPQDIYMKVEFNHAGYGRTVPFMMPYWDRKKWRSHPVRKNGGIKGIEEILEDWNDVKSVDSEGNVTWRDGTDGHYGIRQYAKFSYIHLKYRYDKESDRHIYYLDPDTYGDIDYPKGDDGNRYIEINLYEAKVE